MVSNKPGPLLFVIIVPGDKPTKSKLRKTLKSTSLLFGPTQIAFGASMLFRITCNSSIEFTFTSEALYCTTKRLFSSSLFSSTYLSRALIWPLEKIPSISNILTFAVFITARNNMGNSFNILYT